MACSVGSYALFKFPSRVTISLNKVGACVLIFEFNFRNILYKYNNYKHNIVI